MPIESPIFHSSLSSIFDAWRALIHAATHHRRGDMIPPSEEDPDFGKSARELLAITLADLGAPKDDETIELAEYLTRAGAPITLSGITAAKAEIAAAPDASPASLALATALEIPRSAGILNAITSVIDGLPPPDDLPTDVKKELAAIIDAEDEIEDASIELSNMFGKLGLSAERKIATHEAVIDDPRIALLNLSLEKKGDEQDDAADKLARHIEGQMILNATRSIPGDENDDLYFAFYLCLGDETIPAEFKIARKRERPARTDNLILDENAEKEDAPKTARLKSTVRLGLKKLGLIEIEIDIDETEGLSCELRAEKQWAVRTLRKRAPELANAFVAGGWQVRMVSVSKQDRLPPLWRKGEEICRPRQRFNVKV